MPSRARRGRKGTGGIMKLSWQTKGLMLMLITALMPLFIFTFLSAVPLNPLTIDKLCVTNKDKIVVTGEPVYYTLTGRKNTDKRAKILRQLINERTIYYTPEEGNYPEGATKSNGKMVTSKGDAAGKYFIRMTIIYNYFWFRDVVITADSDWFEMVSARQYRGVKGDKGDKGERGKTGKAGIVIFGK
jgi:hypothetical protein